MKGRLTIVSLNSSVLSYNEHTHIFVFNFTPYMYRKNISTRGNGMSNTIQPSRITLLFMISALEISKRIPFKRIVGIWNQLTAS